MAILKDIGRLDRKISLRSYSTTTNTMGEVVNDTATDTEVWAQVFWNGANEGLESGKETVLNRVDFLIRYRTLTEVQQIVFDSEVYDIKGIVEMPERGRKRYLKVMTERSE